MGKMKPAEGRTPSLIPIPFTAESVEKVLAWGMEIPPRYSHEEIAHWCGRFWVQYMDIDAPPEIERLLPILADVDCQWDLFLANTYTMSELKGLELSKVSLPREWFQKWLEAVREAGTQKGA